MSEKETTSEEVKEEAKEEIEGFEPLPEYGEPVPDTKEHAEETVPAEKPEEKPEEKPAETQEEKKEDPPKFQFVEPKTKPYMTIVHQGREIGIASEDEARNLVQKGFDYDRKVGPHGKLARILDEHPEFANRVTALWHDFETGKTVPPVVEKPKLKSIDEYENANDWLVENFKALKSMEAPPVQQAPQPVREAPSQPATNPLLVAMASHDPQNFREVAPQILPFARKHLTKEQYDRIDSDLPSLFQFYDWVKGQVVNQKPIIKDEIPKKDPPFRVKSGGGEAPAVTEKPPWESMNNDQFESFMAKTKGINSY